MKAPPPPAVAIPLPVRQANGGWQKIFGLPLGLTLLFVALVILPPTRPGPRLAWTFVGVGDFLLLWQVWVWREAAKAGRWLQVEYRPVKSHYVQAMVQFSIYLYWGWYWPKVYAEAPLILAQILFLYVFDALLSWSRGRAWRLGFGPFPIIFSTNFFMWFRDDWFVFQFLMIATGALAKEYIQWDRDGRRRHIFNPSAFGLALFSLGLLVTGTSRYTWGLEIATTLARPHYIYLEIFLAGLIVQGFFGVTLVTLAATATLCVANLIFTHATGSYFFGDAYIPIAVFLGLHLLVTDPATSPRSDFGKGLFGIGYGMGIWVTYALLRHFQLPDFYDKLLVVPLLNLSVRMLDRVAGWGKLGRFGRWEKSFGLRRLNAIHMGCWAVLFTAMLGTGFIEAPLPGAVEAMGEEAAPAPAQPLSPALMAKMQLLLDRNGRNASLDASLSGRLGFTQNNVQWASRQLIEASAGQPGVGHSFSVSRDGKQQDILIGLRMPARLYMIRSHRDGMVAGPALVTDAQTGRTTPLERNRGAGVPERGVQLLVAHRGPVAGRAEKLASRRRRACLQLCLDHVARRGDSVLFRKRLPDCRRALRVAIMAEQFGNLLCRGPRIVLLARKRARYTQPCGQVCIARLVKAVKRHEQHGPARSQRLRRGADAAGVNRRRRMGK